ncbi:hypothetical protein D3C87_1832420 [compost metagenome]
MVGSVDPLQRFGGSVEPVLHATSVVVPIDRTIPGSLPLPPSVQLQASLDTLFAP